MNLSGILGLIFVLLMFGLVIVFAAAGRNRPGRYLREIAGFTRLRRAVGLAVEAGTRLHLTVGSGGVTEMESASAFMGMTMLERVARAASISDRPPIATAGNGALAILTQDTLRGAYRSLGADSQYDPNLGQMVGLTPFSYAAGTIPVIFDEQVSTNVLIGHFGNEVALITDAAERNNSLTIGGSDSLPGQAVLYAAAQEPLIGEEVYAGGAYLGAGPIHDASLRAQDLLRALLILVILLGIVLKLLGLDTIILNLFSGMLP